MKISKSTIVLIISSASMIFFVGFAFFVFSTILNKNIHTGVVQDTLTEKIKEKKQGSNLLKTISAEKENSVIINSYFINPNMIDTFVGNLEKDGSDLGTKTVVQSVEFSKNDKKTITIGLSIDGSFKSVLKVIKMIEYLPYSLNIKSVSMGTNIFGSNINTAVSPKGSVSYPWSATLSFDVYIY